MESRRKVNEISLNCASEIPKKLFMNLFGKIERTTNKANPEITKAFTIGFMIFIEQFGLNGRGL